MGTRADNNEGSCREILAGRHAGRWRVQYTLVGEGGRRRLSRLFPTQREGKAFLRSLRRADDAASDLAARDLTLDAWVAWLAQNDWPDSLADSTRRARLARYGRYAKGEWGGRALARIDPLAVKAWYGRLREEGVGHATREAIKADLVRVANQAVTPYRRMPATWGNPFRVPIDAAPPREAVALTPEEGRRALAAQGLTDAQSGMLGLFLLAGLRLGEQMALSRDQVDLDRGIIRIDRAVRVAYGGAQTVGLPKGDKVREAAMCRTLAGILAPLCEGLAPEDLLFPGAWGGKPRMKGLVYATWRTVVRDAGLPQAMSPHDGRLTHVNWIEKLCPDVSETTLKEHVGHAAAGVTQAHYTRAIEPARQLLRDALDQLMGNAPKRRRRGRAP